MSQKYDLHFKQEAINLALNSKQTYNSVMPAAASDSTELPRRCACCACPVHLLMHPLWLGGVMQRRCMHRQLGSKAPPGAAIRLYAAHTGTTLAVSVGKLYCRHGLS